MSHPANDTFIEQTVIDFASARTGEERGAIAQYVKEQGFSDFYERIITHWMSERMAFFDQEGISEDDVVEEAGGKEVYEKDGEQREVPNILNVAYYTK